MKRLIFILFAVAAVMACQKEDASSTSVTETAAPVELYASIEADAAPDTKIHLGEYDGKYRVLWDGYNDATAVFPGSDLSYIYRVKGATANTPSATLYVEKDSDKPSAAGDQIGAIVAYYPYPNGAAAGALEVTDNGDGSYTVPGAFSTHQNYLAGSFPTRGFPLIAVSSGVEDNSLNFKNAAGILGVNVKGGSKIKSITLKSNEDNKIICGDAKITVSNTDLEGNIPSYVFTGGSETLTLSCGSPVQTSVDEATPFYMGVAPQEFPQGFTVTLNDVDGFSRDVKSVKSQVIARSKVLNMPPLTFPYYENVEWEEFNLGKGNTVYDAATKTFTFNGSSNRWFDLPGLKGDLSGHTGLHMWVTASTVTLRVCVRYYDSEQGKTVQIDGNPMSGQTGSVIESRKEIKLDLMEYLSGKGLTEAILKDVSAVRVSVTGGAGTVTESDGWKLTLDRIVLE